VWGLNHKKKRKKKNARILPEKVLSYGEKNWGQGMERGQAHGQLKKGGGGGGGWKDVIAKGWLRERAETGDGKQSVSSPHTGGGGELVLQRRRRIPGEKKMGAGGADGLGGGRIPRNSKKAIPWEAQKRGWRQGASEGELLPKNTLEWGGGARERR